MDRGPVARPLHDDAQVALTGVLDGVDNILDGRWERDNRGTKIGGEVPGLARVVVAAVVGKDELVVILCGHGRLLARGTIDGLTLERSPACDGSGNRTVAGR